MGTYLHRTTKAYLQSVSPGSLPDAIGNYIDSPDMTAVSGVPPRYWVISGDIVSVMSQAEKDVVDAADLESRRDTAITQAVDDMESDFRQIIKMIISELNILRAQHGLADRTLAQVKSQIRNGYGR